MSVALSPSPNTDTLSDRAATAATVWDALRARTMMGHEPTRLAAVVENIIAAIQARLEPSEWARAGASTGEAIERRCASPSAVGTVLLRLRPGIADAGRGFQLHHLGTDAVGRGAGWWKTANATEIAKACNDVMAENGLGSGEVFRALKDIVVAAVQGAMGLPEAAEVGAAVARLIESRMVVR